MGWCQVMVPFFGGPASFGCSAQRDHKLTPTQDLLLIQSPHAPHLSMIRFKEEADLLVVEPAEEHMLVS